MLENSLDTIAIQFDTQTLWVLNSALALVMFGVALEISAHDFKNLVKKPKPFFTGILSQFLVLPLVTFILVWLIKPIPSIALGMFMVAACPGGTISNFITQLAKGNTALSVSLTGVCTLLAVLMTPLNLQLWGSLYPPTAEILQRVSIAPLEMVQLVSLVLGIPLVLGMLVNYWKPLLAIRLSGVFKACSLLFFIVLVFLALYDNREVFADYLDYIFWIVVLHNLLAFTTGFSIAKLMGLSRRDTRTIAIETGIQNSGLGLLLIFTFFNALGGMALLAAFWGIWHLISGLLLAAFWGFKPRQKEELA